MPGISEDDFIEYCSLSEGWITGVSICGGEPSLQPDLISFMRRIRSLGLAIKIDTNGSMPDVLGQILHEKLADYAAMDIKGPPDLWPEYTGTGKDCPSEDIKKSIRIVQCFARHEFRTTAAPIVRQDGTISFITADEIAQTAMFIARHTGSKDHSYYIQRFIPRIGGLLDSRLEKFPSTPDNLLDEMRCKASEWLPLAQTRG